jgi:hypothetical protein
MKEFQAALGIEWRAPIAAMVPLLGPDGVVESNVYSRGQVVARLDGPFAGVLRGPLEFRPGTFGECLHAELREQFVGGAQLLARVEPPALAAEPFAVQKVGAGELYADAGPLKPFDCLVIEALGRFPLGQQRLGAGLDAERPVGATGGGGLRKPAERVHREFGLPAPGGRLDQLD